MADDDMLAAFVKPDFDSKDFVHTVVQRDSVSDDLAHLRQGIAVLESQLREQVVSHHGRLIEQVSHAKDLEVLVDTVTSGVSRLQASLGSVRAKIREPYEVVASKTAQLERLQAAGEVLRAVLRVRDFSKKLEMHMSAASAKADSNAMKDLAQAASCLSEIRACMARRDLAGVEEVDKRQKWLEECNGTIFSKSQKVLLEAVLMRQQQDMANSLQVFCSLDALPAAVEAALAELTRLARSAASSTVDTSTLPLDPEDQKGWTSKQRGPTNANAAAAWKADLWRRLETLIDTIGAKCAQVWQLHRVLGKRRDMSSQTLFAQVLDAEYGGESDHRLYTAFWARLLQAVVDQLMQGADKNTFVKGMLTAEYPRLRQMFLQHYTQQRASSDAGIAGALGEVCLFVCLCPCIHVYVDGLKGIYVYTGRQTNRQMHTQAHIHTHTHMHIRTYTHRHTHTHTQAERQALLAALQPLASQHRSRACSRVADGISQLFAPKTSSTGAGVPPLAGDVAALQKAMTSIILATRTDAQLAHQVAEGLAGAFQHFITKCRDNTALDLDAKIAAGALTMSQTRNLSLYGAAVALEETLASLCAQMSGAGAPQAAEIYGALAQQAGQRARAAVAPVIASVQAALLERISNIHLHDLRPQAAAEMADDAEPGGAEQCSDYMQACLEVLVQLSGKLLPRLHASTHLSEILDTLATQALGLFVRHVTLLRTLDEPAKMQVLGLIRAIQGSGLREPFDAWLLST